MIITECYNAPMEVFTPELPDRAEGLHLSTIIKTVGEDLYPKWFPTYDEDLKEREINHYTKGLVLEEAWGRSLSSMIGDGFERPEPRYEPTTVPPRPCAGPCSGRKRFVYKVVEFVDPDTGRLDVTYQPCPTCLGHAIEGVWCSPDGYCGPDAPLPSVWPEAYPAFTAPSILECKVTLKSCNEDTSPISAEKFIAWHWQVMGYCYVWRCHVAYIMVLHICGDYKKRPWTPMAAVHRLDFTADELAAHWAYLMQEAETRGLR